jgi:hypothetical protein
MRKPRQTMELKLPCLSCDSFVKLKLPYTKENRERPVNYLVSDKTKGCNFVMCKKCKNKPKSKEPCDNCKKPTSNSDYIIFTKDDSFSFCSKKCFRDFIKKRELKK